MEELGVYQKCEQEDKDDRQEGMDAFGHIAVQPNDFADEDDTAIFEAVG